MERVSKEAVLGWECIVLTPEGGPIRQDQGLEKLKVVLPHCVTYVNRPTRHGPRGSMESSTRVCGLEHVPIWVDEVPHPQAVVGTMHHVTPL